MARKLILISFLTLDGVMQAPGGKEEDTSGGFKSGGWQLPFFEDPDDTIERQVNNAGALLLGRKTYDIFAGYWPSADKNNPFTEFMNRVPKYIVSRSKRKIEWENSKQLEGDLHEAIQKLKQEDGKDIIIFGSGDLAQTLMRMKLLDEYVLLIYPLVLGEKGKRLFNEDSPKQDFELVSSKATKMGALSLLYRLK